MASLVPRDAKLILPIAILKGAPVIIVNEKTETLLCTPGKTSKALSEKPSTLIYF